MDKFAVYSALVLTALAAVWLYKAWSCRRRAKASNTIKVAVGVVVLRGCYLLLGKRKKGTFIGEYATPGGKPERGESLEYAATRELGEETGMLSRSMKLLAVLWRYDPRSNADYCVIYMMAEVSDAAEARLVEPDKCEHWLWAHTKSIPQNTLDGEFILKSLKTAGYLK